MSSALSAHHHYLLCPFEFITYMSRNSLFFVSLEAWWKFEDQNHMVLKQKSSKSTFPLMGLSIKMRKFSLRIWLVCAFQNSLSLRHFPVGSEPVPDDWRVDGDKSMACVLGEEEKQAHSCLQNSQKRYSLADTQQSCQWPLSLPDSTSKRTRATGQPQMKKLTPGNETCSQCYFPTPL